MRNTLLAMIGLACTLPAAAQESTSTSALALGLRLANDRLLQRSGVVFDPEASAVLGITPAVTFAFGGARRGMLVETSLAFWNRSGDHTRVGFGLGVERHFESGDLSPFFGGRWTLDFVFSDATGDPLDHLLGLVFGADYFLSERFTLGGEVSLNHTFVGAAGFVTRNDLTYTDAALRLRFHLR